ncbi:hypothetical protein AVEN_158124-1 [Araneus ventricosus]|uniref:Uncharacterized protein n=1 Tax=Araneus ventricosus TaxID=182803 RepID=A0A4Y2HR13_ARAVE|nr:hypothetical protein AVEN_158124-1 [Araneus ventricosus]
MHHLTPVSLTSRRIYLIPIMLKSIPDEDTRMFDPFPSTKTSDPKSIRRTALLHLPYHTHAVERSVTTVIKISASFCKRSEREGFVKKQIESWKAMPEFDSKKNIRAV